MVPTILKPRKLSARERGITGRTCGLERVRVPTHRRRIQVVEAGQHPSDAAALCADDEITGERRGRAARRFVLHDPHESDRSHAERQQQDVEERAERLRAARAPGQPGEIHAAATQAHESESPAAIRFMSRASCVAMTSAAPCRFVALSSSSATAAAALSSRLDVGSSGEDEGRPIHQRTGDFNAR